MIFAPDSGNQIAAGFEDLYARADQALYQAKSEGKSRYVFFDWRDSRAGSGT